MLRHIAYGYDFVHARHESTALEWIFVDPEFDRPEFTHDARRAYILDVALPHGWTAVVPQPPELVATGDPISFQPLELWVLVEHRDGSRHVEGLVRDPEWESEPGRAEFPEGENGPRHAVGYAPSACHPDPSQIANWQSIIYARDRGEQVPCRSPRALVQVITTTIRPPATLDLWDQCIRDTASAARRRSSGGWSCG